MPKQGDVTEVGTIERETAGLGHKFLPVIERVVRNPDGTLRDPQAVWDRRGKFFVVAVMRTTEGKFVVIREAKYGVMKRELGFPTGGLKQGENSLDAGAREAEEESGYRVGGWQALRASDVFDFGDKIDGGMHSVIFGDNAERFKDPEPGTDVVLCDSNELLGLLVGGGPLEGTINIAMQISAAFLALYHVHRLSMS